MARISEVLAALLVAVGGAYLTTKLQQRSAVRTPYRDLDYRAFNRALAECGVPENALSPACRAELVHQVTIGAKALAMSDGKDWRKIVVPLGLNSASLVAEVLRQPDKKFDNRWPIQLAKVLRAHAAIGPTRGPNLDATS